MTPTIHTLALLSCALAAIAIPPRQLAADEPASRIGGLADGWEKTVEIPAINVGQRVVQQASKLKLWVEQGWLVARYDTVERGLEWQIVLAQAKDPQEPRVRVDQPRGFEIEYGRYFIRENLGHLRMMRERKTKDSPPLPEVAIEENSEPVSLMTGAENKIHVLWKCGDWNWLAIGNMQNPQLETLKDAPRRYDIWIRIHHQHEIPPKPSSGRFGSMSVAAGHPLMKLNVGSYSLHDEGDLFIAERSLQTEAGIRVALAKALQGKEAPAVVAQRWLNVSAPMSLKQLQGKVVMLYFWNEQNYQPIASVLQKKFRERGLEVITVHPLMGSEKLEALVKEHNIDLPIAVDTRLSRTQIDYSVKIWPTYVLISRSGIVRQAYLENPPIKEVEELLAEPVD